MKIALTMEEQFYTITKHATTFRIKSGITKDGRVVARECDVYWNGGAYADIGPRVAQKSGFTAAGPYDIDNVRIDSYEVYTNRPPAGALRGFGIPQLVWAYECHTDLLAREIGMDPLEFRRKNILVDGRPHATGTIMQDAAIGKVLDAIAERMNWNAPFDRGTGTLRRGRGLGIGIKASISPTTSGAIVNVSADGSVVLYTNTIDMGQGSDTAMAQIVAEVLDIKTEDVKVVHGDTDAAPYDMGTLGSRSTFHMGNAVKRAAEDARAKLAALAAEVGLPAGTNYPFAEIFKKRYGMRAGNVIGAGTYIPTLQADRFQDRPIRQCHAVLDDRRRGRGSRSRHRDRTCARAAPRQRGRLRPSAQSEGRARAALGCRDHAARLHDVRDHGARRRPGHQRVVRRLQDPRLPRHPA